jgi:hypothetical protein|nr:MAG TPA: tail fiber protein [Caudoviricetes sp.]
MITRKQTVKKYTVTAGVLEYGVPFPIYEQNDVLVIWSVDHEGRKEHTLSQGPDYSVRINSAGNGGVVTLVSGRVPVGAMLAVISNIPETQELDLYHTAEVDTESLEDELDRQVQMIQQLSDTLSRCIKVGVTSGMTPEQLLEAIFHARDQILAGLIFAGNTTGATMVVADGTTTPRSISDRFADIVNIKDFGAKGDAYVTTQTIIQTKPKPLVIVVAGQSNAVGVSGATSDKYSPVGFYWNGSTNRWLSPITDPVWPSTSGGFVPALAAYVTEHTGRPVYVINVAVGATNCANQNIVRNGSWGSAGTLRTRALNMILTALAALNVEYDILGTVWLQGETDATEMYLGREQLEDYTSSIADLLAWAVNSIGGKIFVAPISYMKNSADSEVDAVNAALTAAVNANPRAIMSTTITKNFRELDYLVDTYHYTQKAYDLLGGAFGASVIPYIDPNATITITYNENTPVGTDDTGAFNTWQKALESKGIGYIPSGAYLVDGEIAYFKSGCFGNGVDHVMDASVYQGDGSSGMRESAFANHMGTIGPVIQHYRTFQGKDSWSPLVDLSFESYSDGYFDWTEYGSGAQGIQVRGSAKGMGNSHPVCIRGFMQSKLNGDGDAVAIWGRCQKEDPDDGINNSDTCAIHSAVYNESRGNGLLMASEHWAMVGKGNGGTEQTNGTPAGATICQHVKAFSKVGMAHAGILIAGGMANYPYGMWNAIQISRGAFMRNGSMDGIPGTTAFKCDSWFQDLGYPDIGWHVGYCPNHIKTTGAYPFNITGDSLRIKNNTDAGNALFVVNKVSGEGTASVVLQVDSVSQNDIYVLKGNPNTFYRALQSVSSHHLFFCTDASGTLSNALSVGTTAVNPGTDGTIASGWSNKRWSQVYASTGTIETSDERLKEDIKPIDESVFKAWGKVEFRQFLFKDAVAEKGSAARIHIGLIAQQVIGAFASEGLDAMRYGIVCYDKWDAQEAVIERFKVVTREETHNEDGSVKEPEEFHYEERVLTPAKEAGDCYSIRYEEALALECAYQRWLGERRDARISALELRDGVA